METSENFIKKKWTIFERRVKLFNSVPFVDFVLAAGSMATGKARKESDLDVIVSARYGRIFTARFFSVIFFGLRGWRVKKHEDKVSVQDKICLNHFVTPASYKLSPPYNNYWMHLYRSLVPMIGNERQINDFFEANIWAMPIINHQMETEHYAGDFRKSSIRLIFESFLSGWLGDMFERILKAIQIGKIKGGTEDELNYKPRLIYTDHELKLHPNTRRIEEVLSR